MKMTIREAALHLNVSTNTIRRRLQVGLLTGGKVGGKWMIDVTTDGATPDRPQQEPELPTLVHTLQSRIDSMELELESRRKEVDQLHQLLAAHSLNAGQSKNTSRDVPWWAFWRWMWP